MNEPGSKCGEVLEIVVLYCRQAAAPGSAPIDETRHGDGLCARLIVQPCSSQVEVSQMLRIIERGAHGVLVVACPEARCRMLTGSTMAGKRVARARALLVEAGVEPERVALHRGEALAAADLLTLARDQAARLRELDRQPTKGELAR